MQALVIEQDWPSPAEGLHELTWIIAHHRRRVPASVIDDIRRFAEGLVDPADLPPDLDAYAT